MEVLAFKTLETRRFGFCTTRQTYLATNAWLKPSKSLKLRPPNFLGKHILSQLIRWSFFVLFDVPHQKRANMWETSCRNLLEA